VIKTAIVTHPSRREMAQELAELTGGVIIMDKAGDGAEFTHAEALRYLLCSTDTMHRTKGRGWFLALEDDALIREDFLGQLDQVLAVAPADIVGLYLGTGYPRQWQHILRRAVGSLDEDSCFLMLPEMLNMVGYAVRAELAGAMSEALMLDRLAMCADQIVTQFVREREMQVAYTRPSIVDHRQDVDPVITARHDGQDRSLTRRAWKFGSRKYWQNTAVAVAAPKVVRVDEEGTWYETEWGGTFNVNAG
jgi:hypothetical protein